MAIVTHSITTDITEALVTSIGEVAAWQTNLNEEERQQCIEWATKRFDSAIKGERTHVLGELRTVNQMLGQHEITRADVIAAILGDA
jgi:hypothetical protein